MRLVGDNERIERVAPDESAEYAALRQRMRQFDDSAANASRLAAIGIILIEAARSFRPTKRNESVFAWVRDHVETINPNTDPYYRDADLREAVLAAAAEADECGPIASAAYARTRKILPAHAQQSAVERSYSTGLQILGAESPSIFEKMGILQHQPVLAGILLGAGIVLLTTWSTRALMAPPPRPTRKHHRR